MKHDKILEKLQDRIDAYTGINEEDRQSEGAYSVLVDLITILNQKKLLTKKDMKVLFAPWPRFDEEE